MENNSLQQTPLISLKQAVKSYGYMQVLKKVDLDIYSGTSVTIFGPNGAGKSTLLKVLSMQCRLSSGALLYNGTPYKKISDDFRHKFGVISHQLYLYSSLSAFENLKFYGSLYGIANPEKKGEELLKQLDLYKRKDDLIRTFSRGMLQRVSIARALIHNPEIIFLDEPYTGLDSLAVIRTFSRGMLQRVSIARALIHNPEIIFLDEPYTGLDSYASQKLSTIIKQQIEENKTVIMVTHDIETGFFQADNLLIMDKGKIVYNRQKSSINIDDFRKEYMSVLGLEAAV